MNEFGIIETGIFMTGSRTLVSIRRLGKGRIASPFPA
jgi:hypothetical protein